jgi:hypothetical protein
VSGTFSGDSGTLPAAPTGDRIDFTGVAIASFGSGGVRHLRQWQDVVTFQRQIGALPAAGSRGEKMLLRLQALGAKRRVKRNSRR